MPSREAETTTSTDAIAAATAAVAFRSHIFQAATDADAFSE